MPLTDEVHAIHVVVEPRILTVEQFAAIIDYMTFELTERGATIGDVHWFAEPFAWSDPAVQTATLAFTCRIQARDDGGPL